VEHALQRRFVMHDLILARVDCRHPMFPYLRRFGFKDADMQWLLDNPAHIDELGLDYYAHSEMEWYFDSALGRANIAPATSAPRGLQASLENTRSDISCLFCCPKRTSEEL
jgi:hypothetical protein